MRNLKKVIALVAVFAMLVSSVAFAQTFTDVDANHDYSEAIEMLSKLDILTGDDQDGDGKMDFRPEDTITRAEVAVIISRIQGMITVGQRDTEFVDVPSSHWASGYVAQAAGQGIVNGYGDGNFGPEDPVLYEQAVKMLVETLGYAPFVADNGGYPNGHLTAASRYGILEGVNGGATGAEATRGMVAQLVYNAIDTPIMDRWTYGADAEYVIYNGKGDYDYMTLLTRDLGVKKFSGILVANEVTDIYGTDDVVIDTEEKAQASFIIDVNEDYENYEIEDITGVAYKDAHADGEEGTVLLGEDSAMGLIGKHVNVFVQETDRHNEFQVISIAATNRNKTAEFTLDQYEELDGDKVYYRKNATDRNATALKLDSEVAVIYNGIAYAFTNIDEVFGGEGDDEADALVVPETKYSGKVTFIDNNSTNGYDVVVVEVASTAVVDVVDTKGNVDFKEDVKTSQGDKIQLTFDEEDTETIINLTKDGAPVEYTELTEWDVLSVLYNGSKEYYEVKVVAGGKVEGTIQQASASSTSATGSKYRINGTWYDVAANAYKAGSIAIGVGGAFYVDDYGKIVAYDKSGSTSVASDNYAFVIAAEDVLDKWDNMTVEVIILNKKGELIEAALAEKVKIENSASVSGRSNDLYTISELDADEIEDLAAELKGQLITYDDNTAGEIDEIVFAQTRDKDEFSLSNAFGTLAYDETKAKLGKYELTDDTVVFFVNASTGTVSGSGAQVSGAISKTSSKVAGVAALATQNYTVAVYDAEDKVPGAVVILNSVGGVSPASNVAVINEVGTAYVDGEDVVSVSFYQNGELKNATTSPELKNDEDIADANQGDIWKFALSADGSVITYAEEYFVFTRPGYKDGGAAGAVEGGFVRAADTANDQEFFFGPVISYNSSRKDFELAKWDDVEEAWVLDVTDTVEFNADAETNVYVYDPMMNKNKLTVGTAGDVAVDKDVIYDEDENNVNVNVDGTLAYDIVDKYDAETVYAEAGELPLGMLDFAAAVAYEDDVLDIVIYKAYDFGKWSFND